MNTKRWAWKGAQHRKKQTTTATEMEIKQKNKDFLIFLHISSDHFIPFLEMEKNIPRFSYIFWIFYIKLFEPSMFELHAPPWVSQSQQKYLLNLVVAFQRQTLQKNESGKVIFFLFD